MMIRTIKLKVEGCQRIVETEATCGSLDEVKDNDDIGCPGQDWYTCDVSWFVPSRWR
jgi:hypothetical protein